MRLGLVFAAILLLAAGAAVFAVTRPHPSLERTFAELRSPAFELNLSELYGQNGQFSVLHPLLDVRHLNAPAKLTSCGLAPEDGELSCRKESAVFPPVVPDEKLKVILASLNEGRPIPEDFVLHAPFVDASGSSYADILVRQGAAPFASKAWVESHLSYFKASELRRVLALFQIHERRFETLATLGDDGVKSLVEGAPARLTSDYLLLKDQSHLAFSPLLYRAYALADLRALLAGGDYEILPDAPGAFCLERSGNVCFTYSSRTALAKLQRYWFVILAVVGLCLALAALTAWRSLRERKREEERRRLSLQILSHEFRTPVASMLLLAERLARNAQALPAAEQDLVTEISGEAFRMQRTLELSRSYLNASGPRLVPVRISGINEWLRELAAEIDSRIHCELLPEEESVSADVFWLRLALVNLLRNAFAHGAEPVTLRASKHRGRLRISVEDGGVCEFGSLDAMAEPFVKGASSEGLGLGLNITRFIVREWGSCLEYAPRPTSFSFSLGEDKRWPGF